jgi:hypothetical protein
MTCTLLPTPIGVGPARVSAVEEFARTRRASLDSITLRAWAPSPELDSAKTLAFAEVLASFRRERGNGEDIWLTVTDPAAQTASQPSPPDTGRHEIAVPHVFLWRETQQILLAWERLPEGRAVDLMGAPLEVLRAWAAHPRRVVRLAQIAAGAPLASPQGHLSFRWIVTHELRAAEVLSAYRASFDHVSLRVTVEEEKLVAEVLTDLVGLIAVTRPSSIATPGLWLQCGAVRLHLSSRQARREEMGFPGTAPNHVALRVHSVEDIRRALEERGIATVLQGSLANQLWWRLQSGTTIEFQQADSAPESKVHVLP